MFMKTFEEKWTAWVDGELSGRELSEFEASLPDKAAAAAEKAGALKLGELLKRELSATALTNEEFFNHQLRENIARLREPSGVTAGHARQARSDLLTNSRPFMAGIASSAVFLSFKVIRMPQKKSGRGIA